MRSIVSTSTRRARRFGRALLAVCVIIGSGCSDREAKRAQLAQDERRVTVESTRDATKPVIDEAYRFRLDHPGKGWKTLDHVEARKSNLDTVAGVIGPDHVQGAVTVEYVPGVALLDYLDLVLSDPALGAEVLDQVEIEFAGQPAIQVDFDASRSGLPLRHRMVVLVRNDWVYMLDAWGVDANAGDLAPFFDSFSLLDGEVQPRSEPIQAIARARGVGWHVTDGVFESAITGLRVGETAPFRMVVAGELATMNTAAEVGFASTNPDIYVLITPATWVGTELTGARDNQLSDRRDQGHAVEANAATVDVFGEPMPLSSWVDGAFRYYEGTFAIHGRPVALIGWWQAALGDRGLEPLAELTGHFEQIDEPSRGVLAEALAALDDPQRAVGIGWAVQAGEYRDFERRLRWSKPEGAQPGEPWQFVTGPAALEWGEGTIVTLTNRRTGAYAALVAVPSDGPMTKDAWAAIVESQWPGVQLDGKSGSSSPADIAGASATIDRGTVEFGDDWTVPASLVRIERDDAVLVLDYTSPGEPDDHIAELEAILAGIRFDDELREVEDGGGHWIDHRFGVALDPPSSWTALDQTPEHMRAMARGTMWSKNGTPQLMVMTIEQPDAGQDSAWFDGFMEQLIRDAFGVQMEDVADRSERVIAGVRARRLAWKKPVAMAVTLLRRDHTYVLILEMGAKQAEATRVIDTLRFP